MKAICTIAICALVALVGCGKEPPPHSVTEFMEDPILLEATMVRCGQNRAAYRHDVNCASAKDAVDRLAAAREQERREQREEESERKRQALRRAQQAAAEARRQALEDQRRREDAEYFGEFEPLPDDSPDQDSDNVPGEATTPPITASDPPTRQNSDAEIDTSSESDGTER